jgi:hypothetical protein
MWIGSLAASMGKVVQIPRIPNMGTLHVMVPKMRDLKPLVPLCRRMLTRSYHFCQIRRRLLQVLTVLLPVPKIVFFAMHCEVFFAILPYAFYRN